MTSSTIKPLSFLSMPLEIRRKIYDHVLINKQSPLNPQQVSQEYLTRFPEQPQFIQPKLNTELLRTCRQIYEEALPTLYKNNEFFYAIVNDEPQDIKGFPNHHLDLLEHVTIHCANPASTASVNLVIAFLRFFGGRCPSVRTLTLQVEGLDKTEMLHYHYLGSKTVPARFSAIAKAVEALQLKERVSVHVKKERRMDEYWELEKLGTYPYAKYCGDGFEEFRVAIAPREMWALEEQFAIVQCVDEKDNIKEVQHAINHKEKWWLENGKKWWKWNCELGH